MINPLLNGKKRGKKCCFSNRKKKTVENSLSICVPPHPERWGVWCFCWMSGMALLVVKCVNAHGQGPLLLQWVVVHSMQKMTFCSSNKWFFFSPYRIKLPKPLGLKMPFAGTTFLSHFTKEKKQKHDLCHIKLAKWG